jgi:hypothetical protein
MQRGRQQQQQHQPHQQPHHHQQQHQRREQSETGRVPGPRVDTRTAVPPGRHTGAEGNGSSDGADGAEGSGSSDGAGGTEGSGSSNGGGGPERSDASEAGDGGTDARSHWHHAVTAQSAGETAPPAVGVTAQELLGGVAHQATGATDQMTAQLADAADQMPPPAHEKEPDRNAAVGASEAPHSPGSGAPELRASVDKTVAPVDTLATAPTPSASGGGNGEHAIDAPTAAAAAAAAAIAIADPRSDLDPEATLRTPASALGAAVAQAPMGGGTGSMAAAGGHGKAAAVASSDAVAAAPGVDLANGSDAGPAHTNSESSAGGSGVGARGHVPGAHAKPMGMSVRADTIQATPAAPAAALMPSRPAFSLTR